MCPYCTRALALLKQKGAQVHEIDATFDPRKKDEMIKRSGRRTFPQIFVGDTHVGGCDDLHALEHRGALDPLLQGA
jgi:glutaredoxin 3